MKIPTPQKSLTFLNRLGFFLKNPTHSSDYSPNHLHKSSKSSTLSTSFSTKFSTENHKTQLKILIFTSVLLFFTTLFILFCKNYNTIVKIENYPAVLPVSYKKSLEKQLRNALRLSIGEENDKSPFVSGNIRLSSYSQSSNQGTTNATFLTDIDAFEQTFFVSLSWADSPEAIEIPNGIIITCPPQSDMKFPSSSCKSAYDSSELNEAKKSNPLYSSLPIIIDDFDFSSRSATHYEIHGYFDLGGALIINIFDYSGGNYESALEKLRSLGVDPSSLKINYIEKFKSGEN
ncbi:hypothetical protein IKG02_01545 [Candidatus Saccharibacteria bacterium]|nr:hypothetical protein [Candidatus Saccharibacteria bacterium]